MPPPPVPPKPRSSSAMADPVNVKYCRRGVLPAQVRPLVQRPPSPREAGRATPSIEPDLVGKDRYDKASKCFSYAPTKALNEAFERPKKPTVTKIERKEDEIQNIDPKEVSNVSAVVEQAQRATPTPTSTIGGYRRKRHETKYGSYRTLNNDTHNSDMDDLCDPDFYLNYTPPRPERSSKTQTHAGTRSVQFPRKHYQSVQAFIDPLDGILASTAPPSPVSSVDIRDRETHRLRNCKSIAALTGPTRYYLCDSYLCEVLDAWIVINVLSLEYILYLNISNQIMFYVAIYQGLFSPVEIYRRRIFLLGPTYRSG
ncbi:unnamed protein product [Angiostrongylus costaricensis]|uniref:Uncharacterized protein n=1 Tax=Angiostrongylus costaricensis TaxID=334426 RepID=A0A158PIU4_ANGCS|nr:unnamed protein product [Angiostrongylus costaricensis]